MAQKTVVQLTDDLDGSVADRTHRLSLNGQTIEIDLSDANYRLLADALEPYLRRGRRLGAGGRNGDPAERRELSARQRQWAREHGYVVSDHGRVPQSVRVAFHQSQLSTV